MAGIVVREATVEDAPGIARVRVLGWQSAYRGNIADSYLDALDIETDTARIIERWPERAAGGIYEYVATQDDNVVGFVRAGTPRCADAQPGDFEVYAIYADPAMRRQGAGRALMRAAVGGAPGDATDVLLWAFVRNTDAHAFYESLGFVDEGMRKLDALDTPDGDKAEEMRFRAPIHVLRARLGLPEG